MGIFSRVEGSSRKKILLVNDCLRSGEVERLMQEFAWKWHIEYDVHIVTYKFQNDYHAYYPGNVHYYQWDGYYAQGNAMTKHPYNAGSTDLAQKHFDIIIAMKEGRVMRDASVLEAPIKLAYVHSDYQTNHHTSEVFDTNEEELECMKKFTHIICVSNPQRESLLNVVGDPGNTVVCYSPIDVNDIKKKYMDPIEDPILRKSDEITRFVVVCKPSELKGFDLLLKACIKLNENGYADKYEVHILGDYDRHYNESMYQQLGIKDLPNISYLGRKDNLYPYLATGDWYLSTSRSEGFSISAQEAMVFDVPVMLTDCVSTREMLGDSEYGIVMPIDADGIYEAMENVITDPSLHATYQEKTKQCKKKIRYKEYFALIEALFHQ